MRLNAFAQFAPEEVAPVKIDWSPREGAQTLGYYSKADITFFGGRAGSGKSDLLIGLALLEHEQSIILRRTYPQLKAIIKRSRQIMQKAGSYNASEKIWTLGEGRYLEFGSCQHEKDAENYQGQPHDFIGIDEVCHFTKTMVDFLTGWNRSANTEQRCRIVFTGNPPTSFQGRWVIEFFAPWLDPKYPGKTGRPKAEPGELRWFVRDPKDGKEIEVDGPEPLQLPNDLGETEEATPVSRTFIPGKMLDELIQSGYRARLQSLPEPLRSILLKGDFQTSTIDDPWQIIPTAWFDAAVARWSPLAPFKQTHLGCDPSRGGKDETIIISRHGYWIAPIIAYPGQEIPDGDIVANHVITHLESPETSIRIDALGIGSSPYDTLKRSGKLKVTGMIGSAKSTKTDKSGMLGFQNAITEWWWNLRELFDPSNPNAIAVPDDDLLRADLTTRRWRVTHRRGEIGEIALEPKEELAKPDRLGRSPDRGDALAYACAEIGENKLDWMDYI